MSTLVGRKFKMGAGFDNPAKQNSALADSWSNTPDLNQSITTHAAGGGLGDIPSRGR